MRRAPSARLSGVSSTDPDETPDGDAAFRFREAFLTADLESMRELLASDSVLQAAGAGPLAGRYEGPEAVVAFVRRLRERSGGTLRPWSNDAWDVAVSPYHAFVYQSLVWETHGQQHSSDEVWLLAFEDGKIARIFQYLEDPAPYSFLA
jgi:ketosteroid isomerase-like protein